MLLARPRRGLIAFRKCDGVFQNGQNCKPLSAADEKLWMSPANAIITKEPTTMKTVQPTPTEQVRHYRGQAHALEFHLRHVLDFAGTDAQVDAMIAARKYLQRYFDDAEARNPYLLG